MQHVMLMDHANVLLAGQHLLTALSTMENVTHDVQPTVQLILVMDHMPVIVTHVSDMLIVMSTESVYVTRAGANLTVRATRESVTPPAKPAAVQKSIIVLHA